VANHGSDDGHLPATSKNMQLVSKLEPLSQGAIADNQIGDLVVFKGFAYLMSGANCATGDRGFYTTDIRTPGTPGAVGFTPAADNTYYRDGDAITVDTPAFQGDVLAVERHPCPGGTAGGLDLYNVSSPASPVLLEQSLGEGSPAYEMASVALWDAGAKAYAAMIDIGDPDGNNLDIFEITSPGSPQFVAEYNVTGDFPAAATDAAYLGDVGLRGSLTVDQVGGRTKLLVAFGDTGYIQLDAQDPASLTYDADTDFGGTDPLTGFSPPEGNANHAERSAGGGFLVTAEQDTKRFRVEDIHIDGVGDRPGRTVPGGAGPEQLEDQVINGPAAYVGYACDASAPVPTPAAVGMPARASGEEWIAVAQRGPVSDPDEDYNGNLNPTDDSCFPGTKAWNAISKGWDAVLIANRHETTGAAGDAAFCGSGAFPDPGLVTACTTHAAFHELFDDAVTYTLPYDDDTEGVPIGTKAPHKLRIEGEFDGWGYVSLYSTAADETHKFPLVDAFAIREALNPAFAFGFGDLTAQEQAADPTEPLAYTAYNSAGVRVFSFETGKLTEQGAFIDAHGNDIAGVEEFTSASGERLIAASDRDLGLYILRYTGPLAARPPSCSGTSVAIPAGGSATVPLACSDANGNTITRRIVSGPSAGTLGAIDQGAGTVTYTHTGAPGTDSFTFAASDGAASSAPAAVAISVAAAPPPPPCCAPAPDPFELLQLTVRPATFRALPRGGSVRAAAVRSGTRVSYRVSKAARASFTVSRVRTGRQLLRLKGSFRHTGAEGTNSFTFTGRLAGKRLPPGRYRLTARATDALGTRSTALSASFRVVR
jgi:hypothetical protein